jgi:DNA repair ATPase RecN
MGNNLGVRKILDKHKKLAEKEVVNNYPDVDLLFFNIPITFEYTRQFKSYFEQISQSSDTELSKTEYNELYLHKHKIIITHNDVITNIYKKFSDYKQLSIFADNIEIYKHFDFVEDVQDTEPNELKEILNTITNYENEIKLLETKIKQEKQKILNLDYIKSKLNRKVPNIKEYIKTINIMYNKNI